MSVPRQIRNIALAGFMGVGKANASPRVGGKGHAITGLLLGTAGFFACTPVWFGLIWFLKKG